MARKRKELACMQAEALEQKLNYKQKKLECIAAEV